MRGCLFYNYNQGVRFTWEANLIAQRMAASYLLVDCRPTILLRVRNENPVASSGDRPSLSVLFFLSFSLLWYISCRCFSEQGNENEMRRKKRRRSNSGGSPLERRWRRTCRHPAVAKRTARASFLIRWKGQKKAPCLFSFFSQQLPPYNIEYLISIAS